MADTASPSDPTRKPRYERTGRDLVPGFALLVQRARESLGMNNTDLARATGLSLTTVIAIQRETRAPSLRVASIIAKALKLKVRLAAPADASRTA